MLIIDVREPSEFARGHVEGAINVPPSEIMSGAKSLQAVAKDEKLVLYCLSGARSNASMHYLQRLGFTNLVNGMNQQRVEQMLARGEL